MTIFVIFKPKPRFILSNFFVARNEINKFGASIGD